MSAIAVVEAVEPRTAGTPAVVVTWHAIARARERCPEFRRIPDWLIQELIEIEVAYALRADRVTSTPPPYLGAAPARRTGRCLGRAGGRFASTPHERRAYVLRRDRRGPGALVVVTTEVPPPC